MTEEFKTEFREYINDLLVHETKLRLDALLITSIDICREFKDYIDWDNVQWSWIIPQTPDEEKVMKEFRKR